MSSEANDVFRIDSMTLKNFRCFEERTIEFAPQFNVVIGENGSGKTAVLEGLAIGADFIPDLAGLGWSRPIAHGDARRVVDTHVGRLWTEPQYPVDAHWHGRLGGERAAWGVELPEEGKAHVLGRGSLDRLYAGLMTCPTSGRDPVHPLIVHYGPQRGWTEPRTGRAARRRRGLYHVGGVTRDSAYDGWYDARACLTRFTRWFSALEIAGMHDRRQADLRVVAGAVTACVDDCDEIVYAPQFKELLVVFTDGRALPIRMLSGGAQGALALVSDMAWRSVVLNPHLGADAASQTPGVVLIDEIDLHLHPSWQRRVVDDLKRAFPKVQFIATTHSPFIIQSLEPGELITLDDDDGIPDHEYADRSIEDVVEGVQGVDLPQMSERRRKMFEVAEEYYRLLEEADGADAEETERIKRQLDKLAAPFSDNVAYHAFLNVKRIAAGLGDGDS